MTMSERLYIGIDLGTFQSTISASNGTSESVLTVVGKPKDPIARNFLKRDTLFGSEALKNKLACNLYYPLSAGVAQDDENNLAAAKSFVTHLVEAVDPEEFDEVFGVICSPSHISFVDKSNLVSILRGQVNAIMVVSEPFAVAFGLDEIGGSIVVDIGAGTTDIARIYGTFPSEEDQITQLTKDMVRKWKEAGSYVGGDEKEQMVELSVDGKKQVVDVGDLIQIACEELIPHIVRTVKEIVAGADPEYQSLLRNNIILSGGGSLIDGLADRVADELADIGDVRVWCADDPMIRVADGALKLSMVMPDDQYTAIS
jgi:rod shape-determining protein MreB